MSSIDLSVCADCGDCGSFRLRIGPCSSTSHHCDELYSARSANSISLILAELTIKIDSSVPIQVDFLDDLL